MEEPVRSQQAACKNITTHICSTDIVTLTLQSVRNQNQLWEARRGRRRGRRQWKCSWNFHSRRQPMSVFVHLGFSLNFCPCGRDTLTRAPRVDQGDLFVCVLLQKRKRGIHSSLFCGTGARDGRSSIEFKLRHLVMKAFSAPLSLPKIAREQSCFP